MRHTKRHFKRENPEWLTLRKNEMQQQSLPCHLCPCSQAWSSSAFSWVMISTYLWVPVGKSSFLHFFPNWLCSSLLSPWPQTVSGCWLSAPDLPCTPQASPPSLKSCSLWKRNLLPSGTPVSQTCRSWRRKTGKYFLCSLLTSFSKGCNSVQLQCREVKKSLQVQEIQTTSKFLIFPVSNPRHLCIGLWQHGQELKCI